MTYRAGVKQPLGKKGKSSEGSGENILTWQIINTLKPATKGRNGSCNYLNAFKAGMLERKQKWGVPTFTDADGQVGTSPSLPQGIRLVVCLSPIPQFAHKCPCSWTAAQQLCTLRELGQCCPVLRVPAPGCVTPPIKSVPLEGRHYTTDFLLNYLVFSSVGAP